MADQADLSTECLEHLLAGITPAPWWTSAKYAPDEAGCSIIAADTKSGPPPGNPTRGIVAHACGLLPENAAEVETNARLIAIAPNLAAELILERKTISDFKALLEERGRSENATIIPGVLILDGDWPILKIT